MVRGLDIFREFFSGMEKNYIIIGGTACNIHEEAMQQEPRATKDIDMILIGKTQCVSNQLGYVFSGEHESFNPGRYIEL